MTKCKCHRRDFLLLGASAFLPTLNPNHSTAQAGSSFDLANYELTFEDDFQELRLHADPSTDKLSPEGWVPEAGDGPNPSIELQRFIDPRDPRTARISPFRVRDSILQISADLIDPDVPAEIVNHRKIRSGLLMTKGWFRQQYGYFEARLKVPRGKTGNWPCFWLLPDSGQWPPEIDILEQVGTQTGLAYLTIHSVPYRNGAKIQIGDKKPVADLAQDFHVVGVDWQPEHIRYYIDGCFVWEVPPVNGISSVIIENGGSGYNENSDIRISGGGGRDAALKPMIEHGSLKSVIVENCGTGFSDAPRLSLSGTGTGAVLRAVVSKDASVPIQFHTPMYVILNLSIGGKGSWTGESSTDPTDFPRLFEVDYVRVYRRKPTNQLARPARPEVDLIIRNLESSGVGVGSAVENKLLSFVSGLKSFRGRFDAPHADSWNGETPSLWDAFDKFYLSVPTSNGEIFLDIRNPDSAPLSDHSLDAIASFTGQNYKITDNHLGVRFRQESEGDDAWFVGFNDLNGIYGSRRTVDYRVAAEQFQQGLQCRGVLGGHLIATRGPLNSLVLFLDGNIWHTGAVYKGGAIPSEGSKFLISGTARITISAFHFGRRLMPEEAKALNDFLTSYFRKTV